MAGILDLLNSDLGKTLISGMSGHTKQDSSKTSTLLKTFSLSIAFELCGLHF